MRACLPCLGGQHVELLASREHSHIHADDVSNAEVWRALEDGLLLVSADGARSVCIQ